MVLFLIVLMPLSYWGLQYLFDNHNVRHSDRIIPFFSGFFLAIPVILFQWSIDVYFPLNWSPAGVYVYAFFNKEGILAYPFILIMYLVFNRKSYTGIPLRELSAWFCGFYFMVSLSDALILRGAVTPYDALILPLFRLIEILIYSALIVRTIHSRGNRKITYGILCFLLPLLMNFLPVLYITHNPLAFTGLLILAGVVAAGIYLAEVWGRLE